MLFLGFCWFVPFFKKMLLRLRPHATVQDEFFRLAKSFDRRTRLRSHRTPKGTKLFVNRSKNSPVVVWMYPSLFFCRFTSFSFLFKNSRDGSFFLHIASMQNLSTFRTADFLRPCLRTQLFLQNNWKKRNLLLARNVSNMLIAWS